MFVRRLNNNIKNNNLRSLLIGFRSVHIESKLQSLGITVPELPGQLFIIY